MSAQLFIFRPFKSVHDLARQAGISDQNVIAAIREAQLQGDPGNLIAGQFRERCRHIRNRYDTDRGHDPDPRGAA